MSTPKDAEMDYCSSCRRHLNGALVCPGCGAYAPDIAPTTAGGRIVPARGAARAAGESAPVGAVLDGGPGNDAAVELAGVPTAAEGRAARRRQRARWKKNQRRAVVATAVALVGGGLTMSATDRQGGDRAQAATAPQDPGAGATEEQVEQGTPPPSALPAVQRPSAAPTADRSHRQGTVAAPRTASPDAEAHAAAPRQRTLPQAAQPPSTPPTVSAPTRATAPDTTAPRTQPPATADQEPTAPPGTTPDTTPDTAPGTTSGTAPGTASPSTSPSELCLLVVCLPLS
ncbi:hypothetical protein [Streptomyces sp. NPDC126499]|uniref:SCO2400 family protein n=1 Tax=Streptomyces sp. NPDC126499 TaxID=3155314 RepID=UPI00332DB7E9